MTNREYYVCGWIFGRITRADGGSNIGGTFNITIDI